MQEDEHRSWQCRFIGRVCELPVRANASVDQSANYQYRQNGRMSDLSEPSIPGRVYRFCQVIRNERSRSQGWRRLCEFLSTNMIGFRSYSFFFFSFSRWSILFQSSSRQHTTARVWLLSSAKLLESTNYVRYQNNEIFARDYFSWLQFIFSPPSHPIKTFERAC